MLRSVPKTPGTYTLSAFATVFNALYMAGGIEFVQKHFELLIVGIVAVSLVPTAVGLVRSRLKKRSVS